MSQETPEQPKMEVPSEEPKMEAKPEEPQTEAKPEEPKLEAKPEEPKMEEPKAEAPKVEEPPKTEESKPQEVTPAEPQVTEDAAATGLETKQKRKSVKKQKEPKPPVEYHNIMSGYVEKKGKVFGFGRYWMALDENGMVVRWYKTEERGSIDCTAHMDQCNAVAEPSDQYTVRWPEGTSDRAFVIDTRDRRFYVVAESAEKRSEWIQKLKEAKEKFTPKEEPKPEPAAATPGTTEGTPAATTEGGMASGTTEGGVASGTTEGGVASGTTEGGVASGTTEGGVASGTTEGAGKNTMSEEPSAGNTQPATEPAPEMKNEGESEVAKTE